MEPAKSSSAQNIGLRTLVGILRKSFSASDLAGPITREQMKEAVERVSLALETPRETAERFAYYPMRTTVVRIANKLHILHILVEGKRPVTGKELAQRTGTDHVLLLRLLRYLVAMHVIGETDVDTYHPNKITRSLVLPQLEAGINHTYDVVAAATLALPSFLARTRYRNPTDPKDCAFQQGLHTQDSLFEWFPNHPDLLNTFSSWMVGQRDGWANWLEFFPFEERVAKDFRGGDKAVMLVDVGGGRGHEILAIKKKYPNLPGRFLLQDSRDMVMEALPVPGMQAVVHNFFDDQPIKGARVYYLRNILHHWPDDKCRLILLHLVSAMAPRYSKILVNELVLPNRRCGIIAAQQDITMMACFASQERSERQWQELVGSAGLKIEKIWTSAPQSESIIELALVQSEMVILPSRPVPTTHGAYGALYHAQVENREMAQD